MIRRAMLRWPLLLAAAALSGCGALSGTRALLGLGPRPVAPSWTTLALRADDDANANSALALDLVLVKDAALLESLMAMPASKWFTSRADLQRSFPDALSVFAYELVPSQTIKLGNKLWRDQRAWAALVFAGYASAGEHRARLILNAPGYVLQLGSQGFSVGEVKPGAAQ